MKFSLDVWRQSFTFFALACVLSVGGGCSGTIHPPARPIDPVAIYVADYGRHSSIVLPESRGGYIEYAFGDWNWFALGHTTAGAAVESMLFSPQSTLSRRVIAPQPDDDALKQTLTAERLTRFDVSSERAAALMNRLDTRYARHGATQIYSDYSMMDHVKDREHYWMLNNCNHLTARWLRKLDCKVDGLTILSKFSLAN